MEGVVGSLKLENDSHYLKCFTRKCMYYPKNKNSDQHVDKVQRVQESSGLCFIPVASVGTSRGDMICLRVVTFQQSWLFTSFYFWLAVGPSPHPVFIIQLQ